MSKIEDIRRMSKLFQKPLRLSFKCGTAGYHQNRIKISLHGQKRLQPLRCPVRRDRLIYRQTVKHPLTCKCLITPTDSARKRNYRNARMPGFQ